MSATLRIIGEQTESSCGDKKASFLSANGGVSPRSYRGNVAVVTLGCAKNQVDSEVMLGVLQSSGFEVVSDLTQAEVVIVNTCGFLESSVKESIDCVLDVAELKETARLRRLIVAGCLVERYKGDLVSSLPEVDAFIGTDDLLKVGSVAISESGTSILDEAARPYFLYDEKSPRTISNRPHFAYVKVAEGCDRPCTFCIIPKIRGAMRSREIHSVVREVRSLGEQGVKEINLVAQDLTSYGKDRGRSENLTALLRELDKAAAVPWIRLLYSYPIGIDGELLTAIETLPSVCEYLDLPLQHSSEAVLQTMKRPLGRYAPRRIVDFIRSHAPQIQLRTTFIVGFPGETEQDIADLEQFIGEGHFLSVGIFTYSKEAGTPSYDLRGHLPEEEKQARRELLMQRQQRVVEERLAALIGSTVDVLVEGLHEESDLLVTGRTRFQAPEVDGTIIINEFEDEDSSVPIGCIRRVEITDSAGYDLIGRLVR